MAVTQYIGARYVPIFADPVEWSSAKTYEPLTIVLHEGNSYTSRQYVPKGIGIDNDAFWAETGNYNAQVEAYRNEVIEYTQYVGDTLTVDYDTVEDMAADSGFEVGTICHTKGYYSPGDGGGTYYILSDSETANGYDKVSCANGVAVSLIYSPLNVLTFGADKTGAADSAGAIQRALDVAVSMGVEGTIIPSNDKVTGATVYIPSGKYKILSKLVCWADRTISTSSTTNFTGVRIYGDGVDATFICGDTSADGFELGGNCTIDNLRIGKVKKGIALGRDVSGTITNAAYCNVSNVLVTDCEYGIYYVAGYMTKFDKVQVMRATEWAFYFQGFFTSINMVGCYSNGCNNGYNLSANGRLVYSSLVSCACDGAKTAYRVNGGSSIAFVACGAEHTIENEFYLLGSSTDVISSINIQNFTSYDLEEGAYQLRLVGAGCGISVDGYNIWHRHSTRHFLTAGSSANIYALKLNNITPKMDKLVDAVCNVDYTDFKQFTFTNDGTYKVVAGLNNLKGGHDYVSGLVKVKVSTNAPVDGNTTCTYILNVLASGTLHNFEVYNPATWSDAADYAARPYMTFGFDGYRNLQVKHANSGSTTTFRVSVWSDDLTFGDEHTS